LRPMGGTYSKLDAKRKGNVEKRGSDVQERRTDSKEGRRGGKKRGGNVNSRGFEQRKEASKDYHREPWKHELNQKKEQSKKASRKKSRQTGENGNHTQEVTSSKRGEALAPVRESNKTQKEGREKKDQAKDSKSSRL